MAINDISLTAGMRSNLVSLQGTVDLLNRTQERLSTGKQVNSALDNPLNYFTAKALNSRANDLSGYKDAMSEAVQTIKAANTGITAIEGLIAQAKAVAASAKGTATGGAGSYITEQLTLSSVPNNGTLVIGGVTFTATNCSKNLCLGTHHFFTGSSNSQAAASLANAITFAFAACSKTVCSINVTNVSGNTLTLASASADISTGNVAPGASSGITETMLPALATDRNTYYSQYLSIQAQIDKIAADSGYKGVNFLAAGNSLDVFFGSDATDKITITGFGASSAGLALSSSGLWASNANVDTDISSMTQAETTLKAQTSTLSSGLSIINTRQDWVNGMVNTLTQGADNLTLADMNEEGANMLMLQTRQSLGTTALSLSAQAAQSVLRLFA